MLLQSTARADRPRPPCSTRAATSRRCPPSGRPWRMWRRSAPQVGLLPGRQCLPACGLLALQPLQPATGAHPPCHLGICFSFPSLTPLTGPGGKESADYQEHAHGLGAGPTGLLGFAESAVRAVSSLLCALKRMPSRNQRAQYLTRLLQTLIRVVLWLHAAGPRPGGPRLRRCQEGRPHAAAQPCSAQRAGPGIRWADRGSRESSCVEAQPPVAAILRRP